MKFTIESGIPLPPRPNNGAQGGYRKYPFREMSKGQSFAFAIDIANNVRNAACVYGKKTGKLFAVRTEGQFGRCWRVL